MRKKSSLSQHRLLQSRERLKAAKTLFEAGSYNDSLSRAYYAMFSAARALLAVKSLDSPKHSGVIALFNQHFVKPGKVASDMGRLLAEAKGIREESDYGDYVVFSREEAADQLEKAERFIKTIEKALKK